MQLYYVLCSSKVNEIFTNKEEINDRKKTKSESLFLIWTDLSSSLGISPEILKKGRGHRDWGVGPFRRGLLWERLSSLFILLFICIQPISSLWMFLLCKFVNHLFTCKSLIWNLEYFQSIEGIIHRNNVINAAQSTRPPTTIQPTWLAEVSHFAMDNNCNIGTLL